MSKIRDHVSDIPVRTRIAASRVRAGVGNAWHRAAGNRIHGARIGLSNARNRRTIERGRAPWLTGVNAAVSSRLPVYRNRINRATGRKHRDDGFMHRTRDEGLARMKANAPLGPDAYRPAPAGARPAIRMDVPPRPERGRAGQGTARPRRPLLRRSR